MRTGGWQLYLDGRGATMIDAIQQSKAFNQTLDGWRSASSVLCRRPRARLSARCLRVPRRPWRSLHRRNGIRIGDERLPFNTNDEEGFFQLAATQPAPGATADNDLYVHEIVAGWAGWSLSVPFPGKALSRLRRPRERPSRPTATKRTTAPMNRSPPSRCTRPTRWHRHACRGCASARVTGCAHAPSISLATACAPTTRWRIRWPWRWHCRATPKAVPYLR